MARPRKMGRRKPCGRLVYDKKDPRFPTALTRIRDFGVSIVQSVSPLAGHLAGVLYLRGELESKHLGHFYSYLQAVPVHSKAIRYGVRVSGGKAYEFPLRRSYWALTKRLGSQLSILHELANDRLICSVDQLRHVLVQVPLTAGGSAYINWCETQHPKIRHEQSNRQWKTGSSQAAKRA
jgi:hypothetical protein